MRATGGLNKKPPEYGDPAVRWLMKLSKAALADCIIDLMRPMCDRQSCDDPIEVSEARERLVPVLNMRHDRVPE